MTNHPLTGQALEEHLAELESIADHLDGLPTTFHGDGSDFSATREAKAEIERRGWSIGPSSRIGVRAVMFGPDWIIAKYHNLTSQEKADTDAYLVGRGRTGPLTLTTAQPSAA